MDIEWGKDGIDGKLYILQARPETVKSQAGQAEYRYKLKGSGRCWWKAAPSGKKSVPARCASCTTSARWIRCKPGDVLVTDMTDPNWEPVMKRASRHRHQPGRPHLPRGDHRPRTGHPGGRRLWRRHRNADRRHAGHRQPVPRVIPATSTTACSKPRSPRCDAAPCREPGQDHDERRQPATGLRFSPAAQRRRRSGPARVHHQQQHRRSPQGHSGLPQHRLPI
jgi:hypothetical protein